jgi:uncharacterized protein YbjT (DUF2867 family)
MSNIVELVTGGGTKTIAVMGATGAQGGAVVKAFHKLGDSKYEIRAITRNPDSEKAKAIKSLVKEVVKADGDDEESMIAAFEGCHGAFIVSDFWQDMDVVHEMKTLRTIKEALKKAEVKHVVVSVWGDSRPVINAAENKDTWKVIEEDLGMYVSHLDGKAEVAVEYSAELPTTQLFTSMYYENFISFGMGPARQADTDPYAITFPMADAKLAMVAVDDIGKCACAILQDDAMIGKTVGVHSDVLTGKQIAEVFTKVCGQPVQYNAVPTEVFATFFPGAEDLANMFRFKVEYESEFIKERIIPANILSTMGGVISFEDFVTENKAAFDLKPIVEKDPAAATNRVVADGGSCCVIQ